MPHATDQSPPPALPAQPAMARQTATPNDGVAIVGAACRLAGGITSPEDFWQVLQSGRDCSGPMPAQRWAAFANRGAQFTAALAQTTSRGYYLDQVNQFDASFFNVSAVEAEQMDPQQRLTLEVAWEALEDAGLDAGQLAGSNTAVLMGVNSEDYGKTMLEDLTHVEPLMGIGSSHCGVANRISYHLRLRGPSMTLDGACASSLMAVHAAAEMIKSGECDVALVGGVNVLAHPGLARVLAMAGATSSDGRCRSFDESANGYGRGEGAVVLVLKRESRAAKDGDHVWGVVRGSATGHDGGPKSGIMAPSAAAQAQVAGLALARANVDAAAVPYVQGHATATVAGDSVELQALAAVYGGAARAAPCVVGSAKANVGHLEAGAGAVGLLATLLALQHDRIPRQANLDQPTSRFDWAASGLRVLQDATSGAWEGMSPRLAAVSSFGYGGSLAHVVVEGGSRRSKRTAAEWHGKSPQLLVLSAPHARRLQDHADALAQWLEQPDWLEQPGPDRCTLPMLAATLAQRRVQHAHRRAVVVQGGPDAVARAVRAAPARGLQRRALASGPSAAVWVFSGHGAQWAAMGVELLRRPAFAAVVEPLDRLAQAEMGESPLAGLAAAQAGDTALVQVQTFLVQVGLAAVLTAELGLRAGAIVGHSVGEIAAAVVAGALTHDEGLLVVTRRALLYRQLQGQGAMYWVAQSFAATAEALHGRVDVAAAICASPSSCVIAGDVTAVADEVAALQARGVQCLRVNSDVAFHGPRLHKQLAAPLHAALQHALHPQPPTRPLYSTSADDARCSALRDASYWLHNTTGPVWLSRAIQAALDDGHRVFLEVAAHPVLRHSLSSIASAAGFDADAVACVPTMKREAPLDHSLLTAVGALFTAGVDVDLSAWCGTQWSPSVPRTPWQHKPYWRHQTALLSDQTTASEAVDPAAHTLLGRSTCLSTSTSTTVYDARLDVDNRPFPGRHPVCQVEIVPAAVLLNTFRHACKTNHLSAVELRLPVVLASDRRVQVVVQHGSAQIASCHVDADSSARPEPAWQVNTVTQWSATNALHDAAYVDLKVLTARTPLQLADDFSVQYLAQVGVAAMGFPWAVTQHRVNQDATEMLVAIDNHPSQPSLEPASLPWSADSWAPFLDAATSTASTLFFNDPLLRMPCRVEHIYFASDAPPPRKGFISIQKHPSLAHAADIQILSESGALLVQIEGMAFSGIEIAGRSPEPASGLVFTTNWVPAALSEHPLPLAKVWVLSHNSRDTFCHLSQGTEWHFITSPSELLPVPGDAVLYVPPRHSSSDRVVETVHDTTKSLLDLVQQVVRQNMPVRVFVLVQASCLSHAPLHGLSRIVSAEHPDMWGALIDCADSSTLDSMLLMSMRYCQGEGVIRLHDDVPRIARLRPLQPPASESLSRPVSPRADGTYLITGGCGALGQLVMDFLAQRGAKRIILTTRRSFPTRSEWAVSKDILPILNRLLALEATGVSIHVVSIDIGAPKAASTLLEAIAQLQLPPVRGVIHAAGIVEDELVMQASPDAFRRVLHPKVSGSLALHEAFPPQSSSLEFFVLFSSCGQLLGMSGQASYASANAFLDGLAAHRHALGDTACTAIQWTSWHAQGMAASTAFIDAELESKGTGDIYVSEAFAAWDLVSRRQLAQATVLRILAQPPITVLPILKDILPTNNVASGTPSPSAPFEAKPIAEQVHTLVSELLGVDAIDINQTTPLSELGVDSVLSISLRQSLQRHFGIAIPPTLIWTAPSIVQQSAWIEERIGVTC